MVVAGGENAFPYGHGNMFQFWPVQLLNSRIKGITVDVDDDLREISGEFEFSDTFIGAAKVSCEIDTFELSFAGEYLLDLLGKVLVL